MTWCGSRIATEGKARRAQCWGRRMRRPVTHAPPPRSSEGNIVVGHRLHRRLVCGSVRPAAVHPSAATAASAATATEQRDAVGLDFCRIALVAVLVVPLTRLETALHVNLFALGEVLLQAFSRLAPQ